jgi:hypothetical protein
MKRIGEAAQVLGKRAELIDNGITPFFTPIKRMTK